MATIFLKNVRLAFPNLFKAEAFEEGNTPRYGASLLFEPEGTNHKLVQETIRTAIKEAIPDEKKAKAFFAAVNGQSNKFCLLDGNTKSYDGFEGQWFVSAHRKEEQGPPAVIDCIKDDNGQWVKLNQSSGKPYAGCYVTAKVDIWIQQGKYPGVRATLLAVQFIKDGDAFAGAPANTDGFDDLAPDEAADGDGSEFF